MEDVSGEGELKDLPLLTIPWLLFSVWSGILFKISLFRRKEYEGYANADFLFKYYWMAVQVSPRVNYFITLKLTPGCYDSSKFWAVKKLTFLPRNKDLQSKSKTMKLYVHLECADSADCESRRISLFIVLLLSSRLSPWPHVRSFDNTIIVCMCLYHWLFWLMA